jgi:hypothetical protein
MVDYVEFPTDPVVDIHWKKKKPPDGGGDDGDASANYPCGMFGPYPAMPYFGLYHYLIDVFTILPLSVNLSNITSVVAPNTVYQDPGVVFQEWGEPVGPFIPGLGPVPALIYWTHPRFYTVTVFREFGVDPIGIDVFYKTSYNQMTWTTTPDDSAIGSIEIDTTRIERDETESGSLMLADVVFKPFKINPFDGGHYAPTGALFQVQAHCKHETTGGRPPQPPYSPV